MEASRGDAYGGHGPEVMAISWLLMGLTTVIIIGRVYVKFFVAQQDCSYKDTWSLSWSILAWLFGTLGTSFLSVAVHYGYGNHINTVAADGSLSMALLYAWIWLTFSTLTIVWAKFSIVAYFLEIQKPTHKVEKMVMITLMILSLCINVVSVFLSWFQCDPSQKIWEPSTPGECKLETITYDYSIFGGSWSAFVDLVLALYPLYIVYQMKVSGKVKIAFTLILGLGLLACACACMRTYELRVVEESADTTWDSVPMVLWSLAESWIILIASSLPATLTMMGGDLDLAKLGHRLSEKVRIHSMFPYDSEASSSVRTSAQTYATSSTEATTVSNATTASNSLTLNDSCAGQRLDSAIAVRREVTVDREARRSYQGSRPRVLTRSWARADSMGLRRWSSGRGATSPLWARVPSWARRPSEGT